MADGRTLKQIYRELVSCPFFPLLFISEAVKVAVVGGPFLELTVLAVVSTFLWAASDSVDVDISVDLSGILGK